MGSLLDLGTKQAAFVPYASTAAEVVEPLADHDDHLLTAYLSAAPTTSFAPPTLETVVTPAHPADAARVHQALTELAEQDPLINVRMAGAEISVFLYGEVQKRSSRRLLPMTTVCGSPSGRPRPSVSSGSWVQVRP